jgi:hypothetical protein
VEWWGIESDLLLGQLGWVLHDGGWQDVSGWFCGLVRLVISWFGHRLTLMLWGVLLKGSIRLPVDSQPDKAALIRELTN